MAAHQPRLSILAGPSVSSLTPVKVNSDSPHSVNSDHFEGNVAVRIVDFLGPPDGANGNKERSESKMLKDSTMSVVLQGRFKEETDLDDIVWGNQWDKPLRDSLPYGTSAVIKFAQYVDPGLSLDVYADQPWAVSPLVVTMDYLNVTSHPAEEPLPTFNPVIEEDVEPLFKAGPKANEQYEAETEGFKDHPEKRKKWALDAGKRKSTKVDKGVVISADFCNGYIDFRHLSLKLPVLSLPLEKYWDGQPVTFVCRNRKGDKTYFVVRFQIVRDGGEGVAKKEEKKEEKVEEGGEDKDDLGVD